MDSNRTDYVPLRDNFQYFLNRRKVGNELVSMTKKKLTWFFRPPVPQAVALSGIHLVE